MLWKHWSVWSRYPLARRRITSSRNWGLGNGIETLETRALLSTTNGVNVDADFTLNSAKADKTHIDFNLDSLAADADGDGNVNGRTVTFTGTLGAIIGNKANSTHRVVAIDSTNTTFASSALTHSGSTTKFTLTVTLRNVTTPQVLTFQVWGGTFVTHGRRFATVNKDSGGALTSTLTVRPVAPTTPDLQTASDSGTNTSDNKTNVTTPTFSIGGIVIGNTVDLLRDGVVVGTVQGATATSVNITSSATGSGTYTYTARQRENSGGINGTVSGGLSVTIDANAPATTTIDLTPGSDTGKSNSDNKTTDTTPTFDVGNVEAGARVDLLRNGTVVAFVTNSAAGTISLTDTTATPGTYTYTTRQRDVVGNQSTLSASLSVTIDTAIPGAPLKPDLQQGSDTGPSDSDNETSDNSPTFDIANVEAGAFLELLRGATVVATVTSVAGGTVSLTDPSAPAGTFGYSARQTDVAGNQSAPSEALTVTITSSTILAPSGIDLQSGSDTGVSTSDGITADTTPSFDIAGIEAGALVELFRDGSLVASLNSPTGGTVTLTDPGVVNGSYLYNARQSNNGGVFSSFSESLPVTIDTSAPVVPFIPDLQPGSDTGRFTDDDITGAATLAFEIGNIEAGTLLELLRDDVVIASATGTAGVNVLVDSAASAGVHIYRARQSDLAGNVSGSSNGLSVTVDLTAPVSPGPLDLQTTSDTGSSSSDEITSITTPTFDIGNVEAGAIVDLLRNGSVVATVTSVSAGTVSLTDLDAPEGTYNYATRQTDVAGNVSSTSGALPVTIDRSAPDELMILDLLAGSDLGESDTDNLTSNTLLDFDIGDVEVGVTVELLRDDVVVATYENAPGGVIFLTDQSAPAGQHSYTTRQRDAAGNFGPTSSPLMVTVDTTVPSKPGAPNLTAGSDTGSSNSDNITFATSLTFTIEGAIVDATAELLRDGEVVDTLKVQSTTISMTDASATVGSHSYTVRQTDPAGNVSEVSDALPVTVQTAPPNNLPAAVADSYLISKNSTLTVTIPGVLANDTDADNDDLTAILGGAGDGSGGGGSGGGSGPGPSHGDLTLNSDGSFTYTPDTDFVGTDTFKYHVNDGIGNSNVATVTVTVQAGPVDDHGNDVASATIIALPSNTSGNLEVAGDADWFRIRKVAGTSYVFNVILDAGSGGLGDSFLSVYDSNGTTLLASDDDGGAGNGSLVTYKPNATGFFYLKVTSPNNGTGTYHLSAEENKAPVVQASGGSSRTLGGKVAVIDSGITVTDADSPILNGSVVEVKVASGGGPLDTLKVGKQGTQAGQVNATKTTVRIGKTVVGTLSGGLNGGALILRFNSSATLANIQSILRNVTFSAKKKGLTATTRVVSFKMTDSSGAVSAPALKSLEVVL